jgi:signal transduction histidine kinase
MTDLALHLRDRIARHGRAAGRSDDDAVDATEPHGAPEPSTGIDAGPQRIFSDRVRLATFAYVAVTLPVVTTLFWSAREPHQYLITMLQTGLFFIVPGTILALVSAIKAPPGPDRLVRWMWTGVFFAGVTGGVTGTRRIYEGMDPSIMRSSAPVLAGLVLLIVANTLIMRARSGQRAALVDAVDLVMATIAITTPIALAIGHDIATSPAPWFTVSAGLWFVVALHGTMVSLVIRGRTKPGHQAMATAGVVFGSVVMVSSAAHIWLGMTDFALPAGPFAGLYALGAGAGMVFYSYATRVSSPGLERLPVGAQVRRHSTIAVLVMVSIPLIVAMVWWHADEPGVLPGGLGAVLVLLALSSIRNLLAARENVRLYAVIEESAQKRGELLAEVMNHVDTDRHRAAAHLHRQAASLHATMASFASAIDHAVESGNPASVSFAAERLRRDLGDRADALRRVAEAVKPLSPDEQGPLRIAAPMRAYLENVCGDGPQPDLTVVVDPELVLDWTTEAAVLRIVQEATLNAWWYAGATRVSVTVAADGEGVHVEVVDDGVGVMPENVVMSGIQSAARFLGGDVVIERDESGGRVHSVLPTSPAAPATGKRPHLRLVDV